MLAVGDIAVLEYSIRHSGRMRSFICTPACLLLRRAVGLADKATHQKRNDPDAYGLMRWVVNTSVSSPYQP